MLRDFIFIILAAFTGTIIGILLAEVKLKFMKRKKNK